jgi:hypothetical protein
MVPLIFTLATHSLAKFLLSIPVTLCSAGQEVIVAEAGVILPGGTMIPLSGKVRLATLGSPCS